MGGITDSLIAAAETAANGDEHYKTKLQEIEQRHLEAVKQLIPVTQQSSVLSLVKKQCNEIEDICNGIFLLRELSARTKDRVMSYGELLSSQIFAAKLQSINIPACLEGFERIDTYKFKFWKCCCGFYRNSNAG